MWICFVYDGNDLRFSNEKELAFLVSRVYSTYLKADVRN